MLYPSVEALNKILGVISGSTQKTEDIKNTMTYNEDGTIKTLTSYMKNENGDYVAYEISSFTYENGKVIEVITSPVEGV